MKKQKRLLLARNLFVFFVFVFLGVIIVTEKSGDLLIPRATEKIENYLNQNYGSIKDSLIQNSVNYKNTSYTMKVTSKENKNLYFYITYSNRKIQDTYQEDYVEGKSLLTSVQKSLQKEIDEKTGTTSKIEIISTLDKYTSTVQRRIIQEDNLTSLKFYTIKKEILITDWTKEGITSKIINTIEKFEKNGITPKSYTLVITNKENIIESIEIKNITTDFLTNPSNKEIINDILEEKNSKLIRESKITYQYVN